MLVTQRKPSNNDLLDKFKMVSNKTYLFLVLLCPFLVHSIVIREAIVDGDGAEEDNPLEEGQFC